ncbi:MAG TPA: AhpC/TSA family protein [Vicinamibacterales bacterium]|nr:AhpC/TSA family protein [Vicinamibacterales bacterium]
MARHRAAIESSGTQVAFVHMSSPEEADRWFAHYGMADVVRVSDPGKDLYRTFELEQGTLGELAHPRVWWPWFRTAILSGHGAGLAGPNWRQLSGVFVVHRGHLLAALRHRNSAARPDYVALVHGLRFRPVIR